jgi:2-polyprenyl-6-hydroxyphenyl methylase/3-demethylubiquinone-9 3-methyltransferase
MSSALKHDESTHFEFGKNWSRYGKTITEEDIGVSEADLKRLLALDSLAGKRFLDIGCGSGIHSLAALRLAAAFVQAIDVDRDAVETTEALLSARWPQSNFKVAKANIFEVSPDDLGSFDIVYSWGVLHHTGDMWGAIKNAAAFVGPDGLFAIAIYRKTGACGFWRWEKALYTRRGKLYRGLAIGIYAALRALRDLVRLRNPLAKIRGHNRKRGMKWYTDLVDWLGGYPYESATPDEIRDFVEGLGFRQQQAFRTKPKSGLLGTGNAEYLFRKI